MIPVIPFLTDSDEDLENIVIAAKESGADYFLFGSGMTMRDTQADYFLTHLKNNYPELIHGYEDLYSFKYQPGVYNGDYGVKRSYNINICRKLFALCEMYDIPYRIKRFIPDDFRKMNYIIAEKLLNRAYYLQMTGKAWSNLYWAGMNIQNQKEPVEDIAKRSELHLIRNVNDEISEFILQEINS